MEHRTLGQTGIRVSELCLGGMMFGARADEAASAAIVARYLDAGGNFIDTADHYGEGASEEIIGRAVRSRRDQVILATKVGFPFAGAPVNSYGASRRHIRSGVEASLRRLGTDWIDLYQVHWPDRRTRQEETLATLDDLVREGKVRYIGASNYSGWELAKALGLSARYGWEPFVALQAEYSLVTRDLERELLPLARDEALGVLPYSALAAGLLTGKYQAGKEPPADSRGGDRGWGRMVSAKATPQSWRVVDEVQAISRDTGRSPAQVALNWVLHADGVTAAIVGPRTTGQLEDNLGAAGWQLHSTQRASLAEATGFVRGYPYDNQDMVTTRFLT